MRRVLLGSALAVAMCAAPVPAQALEPGDMAPAFEGKAFINTEDVSLASLKGRVIFYEIFRTT